MDSDSYVDIIELLKRELEKEKENYADALRQKKQFWELKLIRNKIHEMENTLKKIEIRSQQKHG